MAANTFAVVTKLIKNDALKKVLKIHLRPPAGNAPAAQSAPYKAKIIALIFRDHHFLSR